MEDSNNVHHPRVAVLCWDLSFTPIQVYQLPMGPVSQGSPESHIAQLSRIVARAQSEDVCWIRVPRLARVAYIAQLSRPVAVRRLKTNAPSELQGHRIIAHTSVSNMLLRFPFLFSFPSHAFSDKNR